MCEALRELFKEDIEREKKQAIEHNTVQVTERVTEKVTEKGIQIFIEDKIEDGISEDTILAKLQKRYELTSEKAKMYYDQCVKNLVTN